MSDVSAAPPLRTGRSTRRVAKGFVPLQVKHVVRETPDAMSLVLEVPNRLATIPLPRRAIPHPSGRGRRASSTAGVTRCPPRRTGADLRITVKRDRDGVVSNWLNDTAVAGTALDAAPPEGRFVLADTDRELVAFAGGSGITPVFSLLQTALSGHATARLFYANRDQDSVIFDDALASLNDSHSGRFVVHHHLDAERGFVTPRTSTHSLRAQRCRRCRLLHLRTRPVHGHRGGRPASRRGAARSGAPGTLRGRRDACRPVGCRGDVVTEEVTIELQRRKITVPYSPGDTLLQTARMAGLRAPSSCEVGSCGTCMARLTQGSARMINNDALEDDEVDDGWVVTCQSLPTSRTVRVVYE